MSKLIYVNKLGKNFNNEFTYEFYFSDEPEGAWDEHWNDKPAAHCNLMPPHPRNYDVVKTIKTNIIFNTAQNSGCHSMQDMKDGITPVAFENIDEYEEYPEDGRIVFPFSVDLSTVEITLARRNLVFEGDSNFEF